jgi:hypothetical protein
MSAWPYESQKSIPDDHSYVDFVHGNADGSFSGIRLRPGRCQFIFTDPGEQKFKTLREDGIGVSVPLSDHAPDRIKRERGILSGNYPELEHFLLGKQDLKGVIAQ